MRHLAIAIVGLVVVAGCKPGVRSAQVRTPGGLPPTTDYCSVVEDKPTRSVQRFGYLMSTDRTKELIWRAYPTEGAARRAIDAREISDVTLFWIRPDGTLRASMVEGSDDYAFTLEYCFRPNGMLAASVTTLGAVAGLHPEVNVGPVSRTTWRRFDRCGSKVEERVGPVVGDEPNRSVPEGTGIFEREEPNIRSIRSLPFFELLDVGKLPDLELQPPVGCADGG